MKRLFLLAILLLSRLPAAAGETPAPELHKLETALTTKQEAKKDGSVSPEQYQAFLGEFRPELADVMARLPPNPENTAAHARILVLLGEHAEAVASLNRALEERPSDNALRMSLGQTHLENKDYAGALAAANEVLKTDPTNKNALFLRNQSLGRTAPSIGGGPPTKEAAGAGFTIPERSDISPPAMAFVQQAAAARRQGDMAGTWKNMQAAMNADPKSTGVQKLYEFAKEDRSKHQETMGYLSRSREAMDAGRGEEAVEWAQKAADRSGDPKIRGILEQAKLRSAEMARTPAKPTAPKGGSPLLPLMVVLGLGGVGYGVVSSKSTWAAQESDTPANEDPNSDRIQKNRRRFKVAAVAAAVGFGIVYGGPWLIGTAGPVIAKFVRDGGGSLQRVATSEAGALLPEENAASQRLAAMQKLPWNSWTQYPKAVLNGREYAKIGERLYTRHAVDHMMPRGLNIGAAAEGRGMSPTFVEDVILRGARSIEITDGVERTVHRLGSAKVVTEQAERLVVSINPFFYRKP